MKTLIRFFLYAALILVCACLVAALTAGLAAFAKAFAIPGWVIVAVLVAGYAGLMTWQHSRG